MFIVNKKLYLSLVIFALYCLVNLGWTDFRNYVWTYQFMTMLPGETELEFYTRLDHPDWSNPTTAKWKRQIEIETGLTDRWDVSLYFVEGYKASELDKGSRFEEVKLRTRFQVLEKDNFFVDPLLYLEYKIRADRSYPDKWETKLILAKDIGYLNVAFNLIPEEYDKSDTKEKDWKVEYAFGMSYPIILDLFRLGIEGKGDLKDNKHGIGPTLSWEGKGIWSAIGWVYGLNDKSDKIQFQVIVGIVIGK